MTGISAPVLAQAGEIVPLATPEVAWSVLWPLLILAGGAVLLLTFSTLVPALGRRGVVASSTVVIGAAAAISCIPIWQRVQDPVLGPTSAVAGALGIDGFSVVATGLISIAVVLAALLLDDYLEREDLAGAEMYVLLLLSASGGVVMASANDLIVMFLGLEALSIAVYVMAAMHRRRAESREAGFKYFIVGAFSSAFFLYGIALLYGATGSTNLVEISAFLAGNVLAENALLLMGMGLLLVGFGFKVAAVPFHGWAPDVYQGAPTPVTAFMASAVKVGAFAALIRVLHLALAAHTLDWQPIVYALAVASMIVGATLAIVQSDVKRMLAYSSISHAGFMLVAVQSGSPGGARALLFYLATYVFMAAGSFGVLTVSGRRGDAAHSLGDLAGLARSRPVLAFGFTVLLLAQAGVPLTSGFFAKFYVISAAVEARSFWLAIVAMLASVVAAVLYLRIIVAMYLADDETPAPRLAIPVPAAVAIGAAVAVTLFFGVLPGVLLELVGDATPVLVASL